MDEEVRSPGLSFATELCGDMERVRKRSSTTQAEYGDLVRAMKELAVVEESYSKGLRRVANHLQAKREDDFVGVLDGLASLRSNLHHSSEIHTQLAASVAADVVSPLVAAKSEAQASAKALAARCAAASKQVKGAEEKYRKAAARYRHLLTESATIADAARDGEDPRHRFKEEDAPHSSSSSSSSWTGRFTSALAAASAPSKKVDREHLSATAAESADRARIAADGLWDELAGEARAAMLEAQRVLTEYQRLEETAVCELRDALRKLCVFESSALSNRHYDLQTLARVLDDVDPATELRRFISATQPDPRRKLNALDLFPVQSSTLFPSSNPGHLSPPAALEANPVALDGDANTDVRYVPLAVLPSTLDRDAVVPADRVFALIDEAALRAATVAPAADRAANAEPQPLDDDRPPPPGDSPPSENPPSSPEEEEDNDTTAL